MPAPRQRNSLGRFEDSAYLDDGTSAIRPTDRVFLPPPWKRWKFRSYVKRGRRQFLADGGQLHGERLRVWGDSIAKVEEKARIKQRDIEQHGQLAAALTTEQRWMAAKAIIICERLGVDLLQVVRDFESTHPHGPNARTLDQVRLEVVASKRKLGRAECHIHSIDYRFRSLIAAIGNKPVTAVTTKELQQEIDRHPEWNPTTIHSVVQGWKIGLNFAVDQGYLVNNPADKLTLPRIVREEPSILTVEQVQRLLAATLFADRDPVLPLCRPFLTVGMFAGLRPEKEMPSLDWSDVNLDAGTITVRAKTSKMRLRRIVRIEPVLEAWLRPIWRRSGPVLRIPVETARRAARVIIKRDRWPQDILRHTFASYHFELYQDEARTKKQIGHRDDGRIFYDHYCQPVYPADAAAFWKTFPPCDVLLSGDPTWDANHAPVRISN